MHIMWCLVFLLAFAGTTLAQQSEASEDSLPIHTGARVAGGAYGPAAFAARRALDDGKVVVRMQHGAFNKNIIQNVLNGIDPKFFNAQSRFGGGFYTAPSEVTVAKELANYDMSPSHLINYEARIDPKKILDLTNPEVAARYGYTGEKNAASRAIGERAKRDGYSVVKFGSARNGGATTFSMVDDFGALRVSGVTQNVNMHKGETDIVRAREHFDMSHQQRTRSARLRDLPNDIAKGVGRMWERNGAIGSRFVSGHLGKELEVAAEKAAQNSATILHEEWANDWVKMNPGKQRFKPVADYDVAWKRANEEAIKRLQAGEQLDWVRLNPSNGLYEVDIAKVRDLKKLPVQISASNVEQGRITNREALKELKRRARFQPGTFNPTAQDVRALMQDNKFSMKVAKTLNSAYLDDSSNLYLRSGAMDRTLAHLPASEVRKSVKAAHLAAGSLADSMAGGAGLSDDIVSGASRGADAAMKGFKDVSESKYVTNLYKFRNGIREGQTSLRHGFNRALAAPGNAAAQAAKRLNEFGSVVAKQQKVASSIAALNKARQTAMGVRGVASSVNGIRAVGGAMGPLGVVMAGHAVLERQKGKRKYDDLLKKGIFDAELYRKNQLRFLATDLFLGHGTSQQLSDSYTDNLQNCNDDKKRGCVLRAGGRVVADIGTAAKDMAVSAYRSCREGDCLSKTWGVAKSIGSSVATNLRESGSHIAGSWNRAIDACMWKMGDKRTICYARAAEEDKMRKLALQSLPEGMRELKAKRNQQRLERRQAAN